MNRTDPILSGRMMFYGDASFYSSVVHVRLKEPVDAELLQRAVDEATRRHRWATYGVREEGGLFYYSDHLPGTIAVCAVDEKHPPVIGGPETDGHLLGVFYEGREILFPFFHGLTDGAGIFSFVNETLRSYVALSAGSPLPPVEPEPADAEAEPFRCVDHAMESLGLEWSPAAAGAQEQPKFATQELTLASAGHPRTYLVRADAGQLIGFAKGLGIKPSAALITLYAAAFLQVQPDTTDQLRIAMPIDLRGTLGIPHTFRNCAVPPAILNVPVTPGAGVAELAGAVNEAVLQSISPAAQVLMAKGFSTYIDMLAPMPYSQTEQVFEQMATGGGVPFTFNCSYAHRYRDEEFLDLLEGVYVQTPAYETATILVAIALPDTFCITLNQSGSSEAYLEAFLAQLKANGIAASLEETLEGYSPYVELRETLGYR